MHRLDRLRRAVLAGVFAIVPAACGTGSPHGHHAGSHPMAAEAAGPTSTGGHHGGHSTRHAGGHAGGHAAGHAHGLRNLPAAAAPSLSLQIEADSAQGWNLQLRVERFRFAPENVGRDPVAGEGHAHLFIDGEKIARLYAPWFHIGALAPGSHEVRVTLNGNDHQTLAVDGRAIAASLRVVQPD